MTKIIRKVIPKKAVLPQRKRVAAYARVSSGKDTMLHSLAAQVEYYSSLIRKNPEWMYAGIYADEAITGTKGTRAEFQRMSGDCRQGKIDIIITKSISRFARNTVTLLETVRMLRELDVEVWFEKENIRSMSGDGELMLTILASFAQEESRSVSENCKWRLRQNFRKGIPCTTRLNGYRMDHGKISVIPAEADTVRMIFDMFISGMGKNAICKELNRRKIPAKNGGVWHENVIYSIIRNEKYRGDLLLQKQYRTDHLNKTDRPNKGELPKYFVEKNHEAIIDDDTFSAAQDRAKQRAEKLAAGHGQNKRYPFSGKLICGQCGKYYRRRHNSGKIAWQCYTYMTQGKAHCPARQIREEILERVSAEVLGLPKFDENAFRQQVQKVYVCDGNTLRFQFYDGHVEEKTWQTPSRRDSWTPEMKKQASEAAGRGKAHE